MFQILAVDEEEQFVFPDRSTEIAAVILALKGRGESWRRGESGRDSIVSEKAEGFAVEGAGAVLGVHIDGARGSELGGKIERGLFSLKFLDGTGGNVFGGSADGFVADVNAVDFDARSASKTAAKGDGGVTDFCGVKVAAVLDLHAWFELGEGEEVAAIDGQALDLFGHQHALNGGLLGVYRHRFTGHFDNRVGGTNFELDVAGSGHADLHGGIDDFGFESFGFHANGVVAWDEAGSAVGANGTRNEVRGLTGIFIDDRDLSAGNGGPTLIGHRSGNRAIGDRGLCVRRRSKHTQSREHDQG